jgi:predicted nucleotidyltransferase
MESIREEILARLRGIEAEEGVTIFYACESGSRAWGFPAADSDYDVRFLYAHPVDWYLSIEEKRDVVERPLTDDLDINGWDIRKALRLLRKSNPPLLEWLGSPILYLERGDIVRRMRALAETYYSPVACVHHYLHMAHGNLRAYLRGERVRTKKYFYVLRPILAIQWIERGLGVAPTPFGTLVDRLVPDSTLRDAIQTLIEQKNQGVEMDDGPRIPVIDAFLEAEVVRLERGIGAPPNAPPVEELDALFRHALEMLARDIVPPTADGDSR